MLFLIVMNRYILLVVSLQNGHPSIFLPYSQSRMKSRRRYSPTVQISSKSRVLFPYFSMVWYFISVFCCSVLIVRSDFNSLAYMECTFHDLDLYSSCSRIPASYPASCKCPFCHFVLRFQFIVRVLHCCAICYDGNGNHGRMLIFQTQSCA